MTSAPAPANNLPQNSPFSSPSSSTRTSNRNPFDIDFSPHEPPRLGNFLQRGPPWIFGARRQRTRAGGSAPTFNKRPPISPPDQIFYFSVVCGEISEKP